MPLSPDDLASDAARTIAIQMLQERGRGAVGLDLSLEVGIQSHIGHGTQQFRQIAPLRAHQRRRQDGPMLCFGTAAMGSAILS